MTESVSTPAVDRPDRVATRPGRAARFRRYLHLIGPAAVLLLMLAAAYWMPLPHDPLTPDPTSVFLPPGSDHWFGTDQTGFDVFSRVIASARNVLPLVLAGTVVSMVLGVPLGLIASARVRGAEGLMRVVDGFQAFPLSVLSITVVMLTGNRLSSVIVAIGVVNVPRFIRLVRSEAIVIRESRYIEAAEVIGCSRLRVLWRHVLPNTLDSVTAQASLAAANGVIVIASLNFLGVGVTQPNPTWGSMVQDGAQTVSQGYWWMFAFPSIAVLIVVLAFNSLASGLNKQFEA